MNRPWQFRSSCAAGLLVAAAVLLPAHAGPATLRGQKIYEANCMACHGADGTGAMPGVSDLTAPNGPMTKTDEALLRSLIRGVKRQGSPMAMPPRGGNPKLADDDLRSVIRYLRGMIAVDSPNRK